MPLFQSAMLTLRKYFEFGGRASRQEFWYFFFFCIIAQMIARLVDSILFGLAAMPGPIAGLTSLLLLVPQVTVTVRRLHDVGRSGREAVLPFVLLCAAPLVIIFGGFIGRIVQLGFAGVTLLLFANLLILLTKQGSSIPNKYGASPKAFSFAK